MRILQIVNSISGGGAEKLAWDLHRVYLRRGHESAIIALSGSPEGEHIHSAGYSSPYHPFASVKAAEILKKHFPDPTAVHVHLFPSLLTVPRVLRRRGYRGSLVATEHSTSNRRRGTIRGKVLDELTYKPYSRIVCISRAVEEALVTWKPRVKGRTVVIHNGVPLERFTSPERTCYHEPPVILTAGRITEAKNCFRALKAVGILAESSDIPFKWIVAGDGPLLDDLRKKASELVSKGLAEFHGQSDNIPQLMESADIFFMPSLWEGFGMAAVEAMASGLPVVAGDVPGLRDVVGKETGLLVDPTSCENMARALEYLLKNPENALSMGSRGTVRASSYSIEKCAERHLELYRKLSIRAEQ